MGPDHQTHDRPPGFDPRLRGMLDKSILTTVSLSVKHSYH